jgi:ATP-dependent Clp protease ATP-binding subunit ClpC
MSLPDPREAAAERPGRILVTSEARAVVSMAREEAGALGARAVGSEHLLLGMIRCRSAPAVRALASEGVTLAQARLCAAPTLIDGAPPPGPDGEPVAGGPQGISAYARAVFEQSLREAVRRGDGYIGVDHLLLASLSDPAGGACRTLEALGVDPAAVRANLAP